MLAFMMWSTRAFAALTGVTAKALRHYERRGLLAPHRSAAGYRRYTLRDLARLDRVLALKSLGLPLNRVGALMDDAEPISVTRDQAPPVEMLRGQRAELAAIRERIDRAIHAIDAIAADARPGAAIDRFVRESAWARWEAKRTAFAAAAPRAPDRASPSRLALFREISEALARDPSGTSAHPLAARWDALLEAEAEANPQTVAALRRIAASRRQWADGV